MYVLILWFSLWNWALVIPFHFIERRCPIKFQSILIENHFAPLLLLLLPTLHIWTTKKFWQLKLSHRMGKNFNNKIWVEKWNWMNWNWWIDRVHAIFVKFIFESHSLLIEVNGNIYKYIFKISFGLAFHCYISGVTWQWAKCEMGKND